jgi:methylenetetrahydrofolate reductase (NADPH)
VPAWLGERFEGLDADPETRSLVAVTTATELCRTLIAEGVDAFHFYTLNRSALTNAVCRMLGVRRDLEEAA